MPSGAAPGAAARGPEQLHAQRRGRHLNASSARPSRPVRGPGEAAAVCSVSALFLRLCGQRGRKYLRRGAAHPLETLPCAPNARAPASRAARVPSSTLSPRRPGPPAVVTGRLRAGCARRPAGARGAGAGVALPFPGGSRSPPPAGGAGGGIGAEDLKALII